MYIWYIFSHNNSISLNFYIFCFIFIETRQAFSKLLTLTMDPKSVELRKSSQKVITDLFNLNTAGFSLMLRGVPRNLQV